MFTGIIQETGTIQIQKKSRQGAVLSIRVAGLSRRLRLGDSLSIDGVCLTVSEKSRGRVSLEATPETLRLTNLGSRKDGDRVNLEPAASLSDFLGGHIVQGHVDGTGKVLSITPEGNSHLFRFSAPKKVLKYCAMKGSITVNGVSLTINVVDRNSFEVAIIPHTLEVTNFGDMKVGEFVNLEADVMSKYVEAHVKNYMKTHTKRLAAFLMCVFLLGSGSLAGADLKLGSNSILIYENRPLRGREAQFVVRLARYGPDIFLEWESSADQGTIQLYKKAVEKAQAFTLSALFEVGVDIESAETMTIWLSRRSFDELITKRKSKIRINRLPVQMQLKAEGTFLLSVNGEDLEIPVIQVEDERKGVWTFHRDPDNPVLVEYTSPYFHQQLKRVSTSPSNKLRWINKLPPIK